MTGDDRIVVHAKIEAPRESVWQALTEEEHIAQWWGDYVSSGCAKGAA